MELHRVIDITRTQHVRSLSASEHREDPGLHTDSAEAAIMTVHYDLGAV